MTIVAVNGGGNTPQGDVNGHVKVFSGVDLTLDFQPEFTTEPTAPEAGRHEGARDWIKVESCQLGDSADTDGDYLLTSIQHSATDTSLVDQTDTEASSRLFVGNLTLDSQASLADAGFGGGVTVASSDVNGDEGPDKLTGQSGDDWTFYVDDTETPITLTTGDQSVEVLGQPTETIWMTYGSIEWV